MRCRWIVLVLVLFAGQVLAQTVTVHLINGENGKPVGGKNVTITWDSDFTQVVVPIDKNGVGRFPVVAGKTYFSMMPGPKVGKEPYRVAYLNCNGNGDTSRIPIKSVMERGFVPANTCSKVLISARAGEVVFFAKLIPWWMPEMQ